MKYFPLIWAGLWRKPLRVMLTMLALVAAFVLFGLLQGINAGFDIMVQNARMDRMYVVARFGAPMPLAYKQQIAQLSNVDSVTSQIFIGGLLNGDPERQAFVGFADDGFFDFNPDFDIAPAQIAEMRNNRLAVILGSTNAEEWGVKAGERMTIKSQMPKQDGSTDWEFDVIGVVDRKDASQRAFISVGNLDYFNEARAAGKDTVSQFLIVVDDPDSAVETSKAIDAMYLNSGAPTRTFVQRLLQEDNRANSDLPSMVNIIIPSTLFALLLMTGNSMMQSFRERIPEFGVLKAVGYSDRQVLSLVLGEALIQCVAGAGAGLAIAFAAAPYVKELASGPFQPVSILTVSWSVIGLGIVAAFLVAVISAAAPAWQAGRMQIVNALTKR